MNDIAHRPLTGEIIPPGRGITLVVAANPLLVGREVVEAPAGLSIAELEAFARARLAAPPRGRFIAWLGPDMVPSALWPRVRPKPGTTLVLRAVAEGGGNDLVKSLLTIAVVGASIFLAPVLAPILLPGVVGAAGLIGAGITIGGTLLINALFPVGNPQLANAASNASPTYSISGGQNSADPWGVVPVILGKNRYTPKLGALTYTETVGADQYLRMLVVWGYGPQDISAIKIGETLLSSYADVEIETRQGLPGDDPVTLYPGEVIQTDLDIGITAADGWQTQTTGTAIDEISLDFVAPAGIYHVDSTGNAVNYTVSLKVEYSPTGAGTWSSLGTVSFTARSSDAIRKGLRVTVANGQYDVRVEKTSSDYSGSDQVEEQVVWTALRGIRHKPPVAFPVPLALTALRIRATAQLNGVIDDLNAICQSLVLAFDGTSWTASTISNNPADLFRAVLQSPANKRPVADANIDIATLELWWAYCDANGFAFNMVRDATASVFDTLTDICAAGRAVQVFNNGKWSVVYDQPDAPIVQHFTPRNSWGFSGSRTYTALPHALRVQFVNEQNGYQQDERIVYDDGYNADGSGGLTAATLFETVEFPGVTNPDIIWRMGRFHIAQARLRPEIYTLSADIEHVVCTRGDRVLVAHDVPEWGLGSGRVKAVSGQSVTLDDPVTMTADGSYCIRFRRPDGSSLLRNVTTDDGENVTVALAASDSDQTVPSAGDLFMFGLVNTESVVLRVRSVTPGDDLSAKLTFVDDAPAISAADQGDIPAFDSHISVPPDPFTAAPVNLAIKEVYAGVAGAQASGVWLTWETLAGETPTSFQTQSRDDGGDGTWLDGAGSTWPDKAAFFPDLQTGQWSFRVRAVFADGATSNWATLGGQTLVGIASIPLGDISNLRMTYVDNTSALTWDEVDDFRSPRYELRKGDSWESGLVIGDVAHPPFVTFGDGTYWVAAVARPQPGVVTYSTTPKSLSVAGSVLVANVIAVHDEAATGWTGGASGPVTVSAGTLQTTAAGTVGYYEVPADHVFDVGYARPTRLNATWKATGVPGNQNILTDPDFLNNPDVLAAASARYVDAWVEVSVAQGGTTDIFAPTDVFAPPDVFAPGISFSDWVKFAPGVYVGQFFKFRLALLSNDGSIIAAAVEFTVSADVPDRVDHLTAYALPSGGATISFTPDGGSTPVAFKGGPGSATVPNVQVTWSEQAGDQLLIPSLSASSVTLQILNGGVGVARTISAIFQGW